VNSVIKRFKGIKRLNQTTDPQLLGDGEVSVLENMVLDSTYGKAIGRKGFTADLANGAIGTFETQTLFEATKDDVKYTLAKNSYQLKRQTTGGFSYLGSSVFSTTNKIDHAQYRDRIYLVGEGETPKYTDLTTVETFGVTKPDITSIKIGLSSGGNLTANASYKYVLTYVTEEGEESAPSLPISYYTSDTSQLSTDSTNKTLSIGYTNTMPVSTDLRVKSINIYRTKANEEVFYLCENVAHENTVYVDTKADTDLSVETVVYQNLPTEARCIATHRDRSFLANIKLTAINLIAPESAKGTYIFHAVGYGTATYSYKYLAVFQTYGGVQSSPIYTDKVYNQFPPETGAIDLINIPRMSIANGLIFGLTKAIYRTKFPDDGFYYKIPDNIGIEDAYFTDIYASSALGEKYSAPSTITYNSAVIFSEPGKTSEIDALNIINVHQNDGDSITSIMDDIDGLLILKEKSICKLYTQGNPLNWRVVKIIDNIGCDTPFSVKRGGSTYYFMFKNRIYSYPNNPISLQIDLLGTFMGSAYSDNWYMVLMNDTSTSPSTTLIYIYDEISQSWYLFKTQKFLAKDIAVVNGVIVLATSNDIVYSYLISYSSGNVDFVEADEANTGTFTTKITFAKLLVEGLKDRFRMLKLYSKYNKLSGINVGHTINGASYSDSDSSGDKDFEMAIGRFASAFTHAKTLEYSITGANEFNSADLEFNEVRQ
jgi:hypothetical protein